MSETQKEREEGDERGNTPDRTEAERQEVFTLDTETRGDMTTCDQCGGDVAKRLTRDVVVGDAFKSTASSTVVNPFDDRPAHTAVTGVETEFPQQGEWCPSCCTATGLDVDESVSRQLRDRAKASPWVTGSNLLSFITGMVVLWFILFIVL